MTGFSDGVRPGGLYASRDIQILICYMLSGVPEPLSRDAVTEILTSGEMANLFEVSAAIDELCAHGNLKENDDRLLVITDEGRAVASQLFDKIPYTLRERSLKAAMTLLTRARNERDAIVGFLPIENGCVVRCMMDKSEFPMMDFSLRVADESQAKMVKEHFLNNPITFYRALIALSTGEYSEDDGKLIVETG